MSTVIQFPNKRPTVCRTELEGDLNCITVNGYGEQLFITDWQLGFALGYAAPLAGIEWVLKHYRIESKWCSFLVDLGEPEADGRTRVLVFDLDAAMHICKCARTPSSHLSMPVLASGRSMILLLVQEPVQGHRIPVAADCH